MLLHIPMAQVFGSRWFTALTFIPHCAPVMRVTTPYKVSLEYDDSDNREEKEVKKARSIPAAIKLVRKFIGSFEFVDGPDIDEVEVTDDIKELGSWSLDFGDGFSGAEGEYSFSCEIERQTPSSPKKRKTE